MHGRFIVQQDIKPSNVLVYSLPAYTIDVASMHLIYVQVTKTYSAHVCDLGVARIQEKLATIRTSKSTGAGTIPYKAPEMFTSAKRSTPVDMYSFGCLLIELLTEKKVWGDLDGCQITAKLCGSFQTPPEQHSVTDVPKEIKICVPS